MSAAVDGAGWRVVDDLAKTGRNVLIVANYEDAREILIARWTKEATARIGPHGAFRWVEPNGAAVAEHIVSHWQPLPKFPEPSK